MRISDWSSDVCSSDLIAMVLAFTGLSETLRDLGLTLAAVQARHLSQAQKTALWLINVAAGAALWVALFAVAPFIAGFYGDDRLTDIVRIIAPTYLVNAVAAQFRAQMNRDLRFSVLNLTDVVPQVCGLGVAVAWAVAAPSYWALVAQQWTVAAVGVALAVFLARWMPSPWRGRPRIAGLMKFGLSATGTQVLTYFAKNVDNISVGAVWGANALAY